MKTNKKRSAKVKEAKMNSNNNKKVENAINKALSSILMIGVLFLNSQNVINDMLTMVLIQYYFLEVVS